MRRKVTRRTLGYREIDVALRRVCFNGRGDDVGLVRPRARRRNPDPRTSVSAAAMSLRGLRSSGPRPDAAISTGSAVAIFWLRVDRSE